jgi:RNA polymerase sigma-70 factor (ECF subfamily)
MDKNTYKKLLETHRDRVYSYTLYCLRDQDDAEDVTQEVFLRLWKQGSDFEPEKTEAWLVKVAHNLCVDHARKRKTQRTYLGQPDEAALENLVEPASTWTNPELGLQRSQARQEILDAMSTLQEETRSVMLMHYFQGLRLQDIAQALGKNTSTVKVQLHRARKALRLVLEGGLDNPLASKQETG